MPKYSKSVKETLDTASKNAQLRGDETYTLADLMYAVVKREEVKEVIGEIYGEKTYDAVEKMALGKIAEASGTKPCEKPATPDEVVRTIAKKILSDSMTLTQKLFADYDIKLSALFMSSCISSDGVSYDQELMDIGCSKDDIYYKLLSKELTEAGKSIPDKETLSIRDFRVDSGKRPLTKKRVLGTFFSSTVEAPGTTAPALESVERGFLIDLLKKASKHTKPFIGREDVAERTLQVLCRAEKANPLHVGEPGVGKTAVTLALAKRIIAGNVPASIKGSQLYELDLVKLMAGSSLSGEYEDRISRVFDDLKSVEKPIVFIDEMHSIFSSASTQSHDLGNILKPHLLDPHIKVIGATTYKEYEQYIRKDPAFERRFMRIDINEPSMEQAKEILMGLKKKYEDYHKVIYTKDALNAAVELSALHIHNRYLPDKAIDLIDEAGAWKEIKGETEAVITEEDIKDQLNKTCGIPVDALKNEKEIVKTMSSDLKRMVFGQDEAIVQVTTAMEIAKSGLGDPEKPIGSFLFVGPSGVGKTELARSLSQLLGIDFVRFDMSEYAERHSVSKLFGSPAGYVGYDDGGLLTKEVLKKPHSVVLFDEIEKAHPEVFKSFLQVLDYGTLTDSRGTKVDFRNTIIIFTSNAGAADTERRNIGFGAGVDNSAITDAVNTTFSVEFRNRLSGIIQFSPLSEKVSLSIAGKEFNTIKERLSKQGYHMNITDDCIREIAKRGTSKQYGAREIKRVINKETTVILSRKIIDGTLPSSFSFDYKDGQFKIVTKKEKEIKHIPSPVNSVKTVVTL